MEFNNEQLDTLNCLVENEIESNVDYLKGMEDKKEKIFWKSNILILKDILVKIKI